MSDDLRPRFLFVLQPEFPMNAFVLATEALRIANQNRGLELFEWSVLTETGEPARASNGMWVEADGDLAALPRADALVLFEGNLPTQHNSSRLLSALRTAHRHGALVIAVDTGAFALAQAGLVGSRRMTLHWEAMPAYRERFPDAQVSNCLFVLDGPVGFCSGGVGMLDMMLELIARLRGRPLADEVANALIHAQRPGDAPQRGDEPEAASPPSLPRRLAAMMEQNLDFPLPVARIARQLGVSRRTLERQSRQHFGQTPSQLYLRIRLQAARNFLFYEEMSVKAIAVACGFSYPAVFTRAFRQQFGQSPREFREAFRARQADRIRPEIQRLSRDVQ